MGNIVCIMSNPFVGNVQLFVDPGFALVSGMIVWIMMCHCHLVVVGLCAFLRLFTLVSENLTSEVYICSALIMLGGVNTSLSGVAILFSWRYV
jgi:hypothetical protein